MRIQPGHMKMPLQKQLQVCVLHPKPSVHLKIPENHVPRFGDFQGQGGGTESPSPFCLRAFCTAFGRAASAWDDLGALPHSAAVGRVRSPFYAAVRPVGRDPGLYENIFLLFIYKAETAVMNRPLFPDAPELRIAAGHAVFQ